MNPIHPEIERIKEWRKRLGVTQEYLATTAGISKSALAQLEVGMRKNPAYDTIEKLKKALEEIEQKQKAA